MHPHYPIAEVVTYPRVCAIVSSQVSKRRELSPVNVRRRAQEKILEKKRLSKKNLLASDSDDGDNEQPAPRSRRARGNRAGRRAKPQESESSESSESDDEPTGRRRRYVSSMRSTLGPLASKSPFACVRELGVETAVDATSSSKSKSH